MKKNYFNIFDIIVTVLCLGGTVMLSIFLYNDINQTLVKNAPAVAQVSFKENTVQRHFSNRILWDRLRNKSDVYSGDVILTSGESGVNVIFNDENSFELGENTLVQVFKNKSGIKMDLSHGYLTVISAKQGAPITVTSGGEKVVVEPGAVLNAQRKSNEPLSLNGANGAEGTVTALTPLSGQKFIFNTDEKQDVLFSWTAPAFTTDTVHFELSNERSFSKKIQDEVFEWGKTEFSIPLERGTYWWRVTQTNSSAAAVNRFVIAGGAAPVISSPANDSFVSTPVTFAWKDNGDAESYFLEVSKTEDFSEKILANKIDSSFFLSNMEDGKYFVRVRSHFGNIENIENNPELEPPPFSQVSTFTVVSANANAEAQGVSRSVNAERNKIQLLQPANGSTFSALQIMQIPMRFSYKTGAMGTRTKILLYTKKEDAQKSTNGISILDTGPDTNNFTVPYLDVGSYFWTVQGQSAQGDDISAETFWTFTITSAPPLAAPTSLQPANYTADAQVLQKSKALTIRWNRVYEANAYILTVHKASPQGTAQGRAIFTSGEINQTSFTIPDLLSFEEGNFVYRVQALKLDSKGTAIQSGLYSIGKLNINLTPLEAPKVETSGDVYGKAESEK